MKRPINIFQTIRLIQEFSADGNNKTNQEQRSYLAALKSQLLKLEADIQESVVAYTRKQQAKAVEASDEAAESLAERFKATKDELVDALLRVKKFEVAESANGETKYSGLLKSIEFQLNGFIKLLEQHMADPVRIKSSIERHRRLHQLAKSVGAVTIETNQSFDPLAGGTIDGDTVKGTSGICGGLVIEWGKQCVRQGTPAYPIIGLNRVLRKQSSQGERRRKYMIPTESGAISTATINYSHAFAALNDNYPYYIIIENVESAHALGFRVRADKTIEFFDPNFGYFFFETLPAFTFWFESFMLSYKLSGFPSDKITFYQFKSASAVQERIFPERIEYDKGIMRVSHRARKEILSNAAMNDTAAILEKLSSDLDPMTTQPHIEQLKRVVQSHYDYYAQLKKVGWVQEVFNELLFVLNLFLERDETEGVDASGPLDIPIAKVRSNEQAMAFLGALKAKVSDEQLTQKFDFNGDAHNEFIREKNKIQRLVSALRAKFNSVCTQIDEIKKEESGTIQRHVELNALKRQRDFLQMTIAAIRKANVMNKLSAVQSGLIGTEYTILDAKKEIIAVLPNFYEQTEGQSTEAIIHGFVDDIVNKHIRPIEDTEYRQLESLRYLLSQSYRRLGERSVTRYRAGTLDYFREEQHHIFQQSIIEMVMTEVNAFMQVIERAEGRPEISESPFVHFPALTRAWLMSLQPIDGNLQSSEVVALERMLVKVPPRKYYPDAAEYQVLNSLYVLLNAKTAGSLTQIINDQCQIAMGQQAKLTAQYQKLKVILFLEMDRVREKIRMSVDYMESTYYSPRDIHADIRMILGGAVTSEQALADDAASLIDNKFKEIGYYKFVMELLMESVSSRIPVAESASHMASLQAEKQSPYYTEEQVAALRPLLADFEFMSKRFETNQIELSDLQAYLAKKDFAFNEFFQLSPSEQTISISQALDEYLDRKIGPAIVPTKSEAEIAAEGAAEKAAAEKAAAEEAAAEKAAAQKAQAERVAAQLAAAEQAISDKIGAQERQVQSIIGFLTTEARLSEALIDSTQDLGEIFDPSYVDLCDRERDYFSTVCYQQFIESKLASLTKPEADLASKLVIIDSLPGYIQSCAEGEGADGGKARDAAREQLTSDLFSKATDLVSQQRRVKVGIIIHKLNAILQEQNNLYLDKPRVTNDISRMLAALKYFTNDSAQTAEQSALFLRKEYSKDIAHELNLCLGIRLFHDDGSQVDDDELTERLTDYIHFLAVRSVSLDGFSLPAEVSVSPSAHASAFFSGAAAASPKEQILASLSREDRVRLLELNYYRQQLNHLSHDLRLLAEMKSVFGEQASENKISPSLLCSKAVFYQKTTQKLTEIIRVLDKNVNDRLQRFIGVLDRANLLLVLDESESHDGDIDLVTLSGTQSKMTEDSYFSASGQSPSLLLC